jgi:hypothetical protein
MMSGLLLGMFLSVCTCWFHNMVTLPTWLVSTDFGTRSYRSSLSNCIPSSLHMLKCSWVHTLSCRLMYCYFALLLLLYKNTNNQQMHKESFIINRNTLLHVSTLLGHLQGELSVTVTLRLHFTVEWECAVDCVLCTGGVKSLRSRLEREFTPPKTTQYTVNSTFSLNCKVQP